jgi:hypothetical protein
LQKCNTLREKLTLGPAAAVGGTVLRSIVARPLQSTANFYNRIGFNKIVREDAMLGRVAAYQHILGFDAWACSMLFGGFALAGTLLLLLI